MGDTAATLRKTVRLVGPGQGARWLGVLSFVAAVSALEAGSMLMVFALVSAVAGEGNAVALPIVGDIRRFAPGVSDRDLIVALGAAVGGLFLIRGLMMLGQNYVQFRVCERAGAMLSERLLRAYLQMPYVAYTQRNSSELIRNAFESVQRFLAEGLIPGTKAVGKMAVVMAVFAVLLLTNPLATLLAVCMLGAVTAVVLRVIQPRVRRLGRTAQGMASENIQSLQECLHGWREIRLLGREDNFVSEYAQDRRKLARARYLRRTAAETPKIVLETGVVLAIAALISVVVMVRGTGLEAVPVVALFGYAALRLVPEVNQITQGLTNFKFVSPAIEDIYADLTQLESDRSEIKEPGPVERFGLREKLAIEGVWVRYPGSGSYNLADVDMTVAAGEFIGLVGPTGGGKSTLMDVIVGLLEPERGRVLVDGRDLRECTRGWQMSLGVVPQAIVLVDDTVRKNIALGVPDEEIDEDAVNKAARVAQAEEFIESLPEAYDTYVGERGVRLSGGQRQRLAIARALYREPDVLVLDEGSSALDVETEAALMRSLKMQRSDRTVIMAAHRLGSLGSCDWVAVIREGRVQDRGAYRDVVERNFPSGELEVGAERHGGS